MLDTKSAYEILGLKIGANKNEVESRFTIILKRHKLETGEGNGTIDIDRVTEAYNLLMGYTEEIPQPSGKPSPIFKKLGIDQKKAENFLYYYKVHIIVGIILLIASFFFVKDLVTRVDPNFKLAFIGEFYYDDTVEFKNEIKKALPDIKEMMTDQALIYPSDKSEQASTMYDKIAVIFAGEKIDLFILDKSNFDTYAKQGAFKSLDGLPGTLGIDKTANKDYIIKLKDEKSEHLYGVDVSKCKLFKNSGIQGKQMIAALGFQGEFSDNTVKVLQLLLKQQ